MGIPSLPLQGQGRIEESLPPHQHLREHAEQGGWARRNAPQPSPEERATLQAL